MRQSITLPSGHRIRLPHTEARTLFDENANHFRALEQAADAVRLALEQDGLLVLSDLLRRESRSFHMAFQLMLIEAHEVMKKLVAEAAPSSPEAASVIRIGLLNYAAALLMPYAAILEAATALRYDVEILAARFTVSLEQAAQHFSTLQRSGARGVPLFFLRMDAASTSPRRSPASAST